MLLELPTSNYPLVKPLVPSPGDIHVHVLGVLDRNNRGKVYVDDIERPRSALVWAMGCLFALIGDSGNAAFNGALYAFLRNRLGPESVESCGGTHFYLPVYEDIWDKVINDILQPIMNHAEYETAETLFYVFNNEKYLNLRTGPYALPEGYTIRRIDRDVVECDPDRALEADLLCDFWDSAGRFLETGFGYCVMEGDCPVSVCFSGYVSGRYHDVVIRTYDKSRRGQGLATAATRAYLDECVNRALCPAWMTTADNIGSVRIAEKCGFDLYRKRSACLFPFAIL